MASRSSSRRLAALLALGFAVGSAGLASGEEAAGPGNDEAAKLDRVRKEIRRIEALLSKNRTEAKSVLGDLERLDLELALHAKQIASIDGDLLQCRRDIQEANARVKESGSRLDATRREMGARVRALYLAGPLRLEKALLTAQSGEEVVSAYQLATQAALLDGRRAEELQARESEWRTAVTELESRKATLGSLRREEISRRQALEKSRAERSRLLTGLRREASDEEGFLAEITETEKSLTRLVEALGKGGNVPPEMKVGFGSFRGLLLWPVPGGILVPFGAQRSTKFETLVPHPGIDLSVTDGEPVKSVHEGVVAFSDWFKGYGNLIIVDHGDGFMTVYAHASERLVASGDVVTAGQIIAKAGDTGSLEGPRLFFEIVKDGKPENPVGWLIRR